MLLLPLTPLIKNLFKDTPMRISESKNSSARPTETENGNTMPPPTPGLAHFNHTTEILDGQPKTDHWTRGMINFINVLHVGLV